MPTRILQSFAAVAACLIASACGQTKPADSKPAGTATPASQWISELRPLELPITAPASMPQLTRAGSGVTLSWVETSKDAASLRYAEWTGDKWSAPGTAASGKNWFLSAADVPAVTRLSSGPLVANWFVGTKPEEEAYDLLLSYSTDEGKTWAKSIKPPRDTSQTQHGFASIVETPDHGIGIVWLDGREGAHAKDPESAEMTLRFTSFDRDWKQGPDVAVNTRVCECCQTAAAVTTDGIVTAFRDRSDKEIRDIAVARLDGTAWTPGTLVHADNFKTDSCPVNGPALSARGNDLAVAWYTVQNKGGQSFAAFSHDAGRTWSAPIRLDGGQSLGMVDVELLEDGSAAATWVEFANGHRTFKLRRVEANGTASAPVDLPGQESGRVSGYPRMSRDKDTLLFTWAEGSGDPSGADEGAPGKIRGAIAKIAPK
jgi:hypothetical protein